jgi:hypothetical protein
LIGLLRFTNGIIGPRLAPKLLKPLLDRTPDIHNESFFHNKSFFAGMPIAGVLQTFYDLGKCSFSSSVHSPVFGLDSERANVSRP